MSHGSGGTIFAPCAKTAQTWVLVRLSFPLFANTYLPFLVSPLSSHMSHLPPLPLPLPLLSTHHYYLVLDITNDLPDPKVIDQWLGEPVRAAVLPTSVSFCFYKNFFIIFIFDV
jgi:hypothetical protein